jgi:hypothetical protein
VLSCAVGVVMLIVCANLSNLQLARLGTRQKEMAMRSALGAGRLRLLRQLLTESVTLSCCGAALGLILAVAGTRAIAHLDAFDIPLLASVRLDGDAFGFTLLAAVLTGVLFGLLPALQVRSFAVGEVLKDGSRGSSGGRRHAWVRNGLVVSEIAFACTLLVGAGLLMRSFLRVLRDLRSDFVFGESAGAGDWDSNGAGGFRDSSAESYSSAYAWIGCPGAGAGNGSVASSDGYARKLVVWCCPRRSGHIYQDRSAADCGGCPRWVSSRS